MENNKSIKHIKQNIEEYAIPVVYSGDTSEEYVRSLEERLAWAEYELSLNKETIDDLYSVLEACNNALKKDV